jgi:polyhydroxybutyrate depolymerase
MRHHRPILLPFALAMLAAVAAPIGRAAMVGAAADTSTAGGARTLHVQLRHDGLTRSYVLHIPPQAAAGAPLPLMLNFHGAMGSGLIQERFTGMDATADRHGFVVAYPDGTSAFAGRRGGGGNFGLLWNAGTCCARAVIDQVDDVGFALALVDDVAHRTSIDLGRVYATGMSNGAMLAHRLAAEAPDRIAAIAPVAGGLVYQRFAPTRAVPLLHIHSVDDPRALYNGGLGPSWSGYQVLHPDILAMMAQWAKADACTGGPQVVDTRRAKNGDTATLLRWQGCPAGVEVAHWKLTGAGHVWPGHPAHQQRLLGNDTLVLDANEEIWSFVSRFRR